MSITKLEMVINLLKMLLGPGVVEILEKETETKANDTPEKRVERIVWGAMKMLQTAQKELEKRVEIKAKAARPRKPRTNRNPPRKEK
jgi:hypothetical protein